MGDNAPIVFADDEMPAYAPQVPWMQSKTIRENILFGSPYDEEKYMKVLKLCQLESDLKHSFPGGDLTELGERGTNLSGG